MASSSSQTSAEQLLEVVANIAIVLAALKYLFFEGRENTEKRGSADTVFVCKSGEHYHLPGCKHITSNAACYKFCKDCKKKHK